MTHGSNALVLPRYHLPRAAGVALPLFALRGPQSIGTGEILDLIPFVDWLAQWHQRLVQLLPLNETAVGEASPYNTLSAFAIDPAYISIFAVPEIERSPAARERIAAGRTRTQLRRWRHAPERQRRSIYTFKLRLLDLAFDAFEQRPASTERGAAFAEFCRLNGWWLDDYALFRALKERRRWTSWETWPAALRQRDGEELRRVATTLRPRIRFFQYVQWIAAEQWSAVRAHARRRGVLIKGDLSFVCGRDSADVWAHQDLFDLSSSAGAPPDAFSATGQAWGLPLYDWEAVRASGYEWWRQRARQARELYDLFRVDHVVGLYRTYAIAVSEGGTAGFVPHDHHAQATQGRALLAAVLQEAGAAAGVIAEDLGTVPDWVRDSLTQLGIPGYKVFRWERHNSDLADPRSYAPLSVATTGTHDTDTLVAWWDTLPSDERHAVIRALDLTGAGVNTHDAAVGWTPDLHMALLQRLYEAGSLLTILPIQDLFGWHDRINTPATTDSHNWSYRLPVETSQLNEIADVRDRMERVRTLIAATGRWEGSAAQG